MEQDPVFQQPRESLQLADQYYDGLLTPSQASDFEERMRKDNEFKVEVLPHLLAREAIDQAGKGEIKAWVQEGWNESTGNNGRIWTFFAVAAGILLICLIGWITLPSSSPALADLIAEEDGLVNPSIRTPRNPHDASLKIFRDASSLYGSGDFAECIPMLEACILDTGFHSKSLAYLLLGSAQIQVGSLNKAVSSLEKVGPQSSSYSEALYLMGVSFLWEGKWSDAKEKLEELVGDFESNREDRAVALLAAMERENSNNL